MVWMAAPARCAWLLLVLAVTSRSLVSPRDKLEDKGVEEEEVLECEEDEFLCGDGTRCLPARWVCDSSIDCLDGSDEPSSCPEVTCGPGEFRCPLSGKCVMEAWLCDGEVDCHLAGVEDEGDEHPSICQLDSPCSPAEEACSDGACLALSKHCDGVRDCRDYSDEGTFCGETSCLDLTCSHSCTQTRRGPRCFCPPGKQPHGNNGTSCRDSNECLTEGVCDQICGNTVGSFKCSCVPGYQFTPPTSCRAVNVPPSHPPTLIFANSVDVQHVHLNGTLIGRAPSQETLALDFNHRNQTICWISNAPLKSGHNSSLKCAKIDKLHNSWNLPSPFFRFVKTV